MPLQFLDPATGAAIDVTADTPLPVTGSGGGMSPEDFIATAPLSWDSATTTLSITITAADVSDATTVGRNVMKAESASAARSAIGAGTSNLTLGTTASTALAGNYKPAWGDVTGKPAFGTAAQADTGDFATSAQGAKADSAVQPGDLSPYAKTADLALSDASVAANVPTGSTVDDLVAALVAAGLMASA